MFWRSKSVVALLLTLSLVSCTNFAPQKTACGPTATFRLLDLYDDVVCREDISNDISKHPTFLGASLRIITSPLPDEDKGITTPTEIKRFLERRGYSVSFFRGTSDECKAEIVRLCDLNQTGIALSSDGYNFLRMHYECFPPVDSPGSRFGSNAQFVVLLVVSHPTKSVVLPNVPFDSD
jgi:hypothetical protein